MTFMKENARSHSMHLSVSMFMSAYAELEDALQWTFELLVKSNGDLVGDVPDAQCVTDRSIAVRALMDDVEADKKPPQDVSDDILRECLVAQALYEHISTKYSTLAEPAKGRRQPGSAGSDEIRRQAGRMLDLAAKVLSLHALYHSPVKIDRRSGKLPAGTSRKEYWMGL